MTSKERIGKGEIINGLIGCKANLNREEKEAAQPTKAELMFLPLSLVDHEANPNCTIVPAEGFHGYLGLKVSFICSLNISY